jgi:hypothetical protein
LASAPYSLNVFRPRGRAKVPKKIVPQRPNKGQEFLFQSSVGLWCFVATFVRILDFFAHDDMLAEACHADGGMRSSKRIHESGAEIILGGEHRHPDTVLTKPWLIKALTSQPVVIGAHGATKLLSN